MFNSLKKILKKSIHGKCRFYRAQVKNNFPSKGVIVTRSVRSRVEASGACRFVFSFLFAMHL